MQVRLFQASHDINPGMGVVDFWRNHMLREHDINHGRFAYAYVHLRSKVAEKMQAQHAGCSTKESQELEGVHDFGRHKC